MNIHPTAEIGCDVQMASNVAIWRFTTVMDKVVLGENTILGSYVYVGAEVKIGANCKIQNNASIFEGSFIGEGVFIGPGAILTNDRYPRSTNQSGKLKKSADWTRASVVVNSYASIGAGAICVAPIVIGQYALIGAGSIVTRNVSDFEYGFGNPYLRKGWVGRSGFPLKRAEKPDLWVCPKSGDEYLEYITRDRSYLKLLAP